MLMPWIRSGDAELVHPPGDVEGADEHDEEHHDAEQHPADGAVLPHVADRVAVVLRAAAGHEELEHLVAQVAEDVAEHDDQEDAALEQGRQGVQAVPLPVGQGSRGGRVALPRWRGRRRSGSEAHRRS